MPREVKESLICRHTLTCQNVTAAAAIMLLLLAALFFTLRSAWFCRTDSHAPSTLVKLRSGSSKRPFCRHSISSGADLTRKNRAYLKNIAEDKETGGMKRGAEDEEEEKEEEKGDREGRREERDGQRY